MKYKLLKDTVTAPAGSIYKKQYFIGLCKERYAPISELGKESLLLNTYSVGEVEGNPGWFELIDERWRPKTGEEYWFVRDDGVVTTSVYDATSLFILCRHSSGNMFLTKKQALEAAQRIKQTFLDYQKELETA